MTVTTLARGHSGHVATGPLSRPPERLAAGVECVWKHDSGGNSRYTMFWEQLKTLIIISDILAIVHSL